MQWCVVLVINRQISSCSLDDSWRWRDIHARRARRFTACTRFVDGCASRTKYTLSVLRVCGVPWLSSLQPVKMSNKYRFHTLRVPPGRQGRFQINRRRRTSGNPLTRLVMSVLLCLEPSDLLLHTGLRNNKPLGKRLFSHKCTRSMYCKVCPLTVPLEGRHMLGVYL